MKPSKQGKQQTGFKAELQAAGRVLPQNQHYNVKKEALGPNTKRSK